MLCVRVLYRNKLPDFLFNVCGFMLGLGLGLGLGLDFGFGLG